MPDQNHQEVLADMEERRQLTQVRRQREAEARAWQQEQASKALWESYDPSWLEEAQEAVQRARQAKAARETRDRIRLEVDLSAIELDQATGPAEA